VQCHRRVAGPEFADLPDAADRVAQIGDAQLMKGPRVGAQHVIEYADRHLGFEGRTNMGEQHRTGISQRSLQNDRDGDAHRQHDGRAVCLVRQDAIVCLQQRKRHGEREQVACDRGRYAGRYRSSRFR
jgi:hypothetical protein